MVLETPQSQFESEGAYYIEMVQWLLERSGSSPLSRIKKRKGIFYDL